MVDNTGKLSGLTVFITGASRGIGKAIALKVAKDGANVVIAAKTANPHPKLPGTIYTACQEVERAGGKCLPCIVDVRDENQIRRAVQQAVEKFGGIDIVVNNAGAIALTPGSAQIDVKRVDLMHQVNGRAAFLVSRECFPYLQKSPHAHILNMSPPLNLNPRWFASTLAYTISKYSMSMCVLGMHEEFRPDGIAVNALWPKTRIYTSAVEHLRKGDGDAFRCSRRPEIVADAAYYVLCQDPRRVTGNFFIDEDVVRRAGVKDLSQYACDPKGGSNLKLDIFVDEDGGSGDGERKLTSKM